MSSEQTPAASAAIESKFKPIVFTNEPDEEADAKLTPGRKNLKEWLGRMVRVTLRNKLILMGVFSCTDHDQNVVIANCEAFVPNDATSISYGNVMVPGSEIVAFQVDMKKKETEKQSN